MADWEGSQLNKAKEILAYELTKLVHGEEEAEKAQEMRKQQARVLGEQASTKLLFPMILMLIVTFVILLIPACISFA